MGPKATITIVLCFILLVLTIIGAKSIFEYVDANERVVFQSLDGSLSCSTDPGPYWQGFGKAQVFKKRQQFEFKNASDALRIRFNDNAHATISGSISWEVPSDCRTLISIYQKYSTPEYLEQHLIRTVIEKSVYMSGPMMSSTESAAERRNEILQLIEDQIENGVYFTKTVQVEQPDPITNERKRVAIVELVRDKHGLPVRAAESPLKEFGIRTFNLAINEIAYSKEVEEQIQQQQKASMQVRIAIAKAKEAEQDAITAAERGKANAAMAKWEQEKENATIIAQAEGKRKAEEQNAIAMKFYRDAQLLKAEGDAGYRAKIMQADNALEKRLEAYLEAQKVWAKAMSDYRGNWVPAVQSGGATGGQNGAMNLIDLLTAKVAKDLGVDLGIGRPQK